MNEKTIEKMRKRQIEVKKKAQNRHFKKQKERYEKSKLINRNYRKFNNIILGRGESKEHLYAKSVLGIYLNIKGEDFISEFKFSNGEADCFCPNLLICI